MSARKPQRAVGDEPGRRFESVAVADHEIAMPVFRTLDGRDVLDVGKRLTDVAEPVRVALGGLDGHRVDDVRQIRGVGTIAVGAAGRAGTTHGVAPGGDAPHAGDEHPPETVRNREGLRVTGSRRRGRAGRPAGLSDDGPRGRLGAEGDPLGLTAPGDDPLPAGRGTLRRIGHNPGRRLRRVREVRSLAFGGRSAVRSQPQGLRRDPERLRHVDRNFVTADTGAPGLQAFPQVIGNGRLHGQLEGRAAPHPGQVSRIDRA